MRRIAVISSDKMLERAVVLALECSAAAASAGCRREVEVMPLGDCCCATADELCEAAAGCDKVVILGAAGVVSGGLPAELIRRRDRRRPEIYVVSWQHSEQTVLGLIEGGADQYMTFPVNLRRLCLKVLSK